MNYKGVMMYYAAAYTTMASGFVAADKGMNYIAIVSYLIAIPLFIIARQKLKNMIKRNKDDK